MACAVDVVGTKILGFESGKEKGSIGVLDIYLMDGHEGCVKSIDCVSCHHPHSIELTCHDKSAPLMLLGKQTNKHAAKRDPFPSYR